MLIDLFFANSLTCAFARSLDIPARNLSHFLALLLRARALARLTVPFHPGFFLRELWMRFRLCVRACLAHARKTPFCPRTNFQ